MFEFLLIGICAAAIYWIDGAVGSKQTTRPTENHARPIASWRIRYRDADGSESERDIDVEGAQKDGRHTMFFAFCRLRNDHRSFRSDRILSCIDLDTGEVIDNPARHIKGKA